MSTGSHEPPRTPTATELVGLYTRTLVAYLLAVILLWAVGIEAIYGHPTPFYALHFPAFKSLAVPIAAALTALLVYTLMRKREGGNFALSPGKTGTTPPSSARIQGAFPVYIIPFTAVVLALLLGIALYQDASRNSLEAAIAAFWADYRWHLLAIAVFANGLGALLIYVRRFGWFRDAAGPRETLWWILAVYVFVVAFACAIAMLRNGPEGIAQAYSRQAYEYIGDIGKTRNIHDLFARYEEIHPYLSMHAKVHPPGPIAVLWIMSYLVTQSPMALSLATILFGSLSVVPLYFWARDLGGTPFARTASLIYALSPSIVIFTATSADILFTPVTIGTLFLFDRALGRVSWRYAVAAGIGFACMSLLKFSLIGIGAYFAFIGLWTLRDRSRLPSVVQTAAVMLAAFLALHLAVYWWSGFNAITTFETARMQF
ncbi:MAG: glycosyltransferase family 39 protein, partial [Candidatus Hydrogenedentes bacterium]|nr:glycosyltransferase family 39 protein [Candidatus Hydrogenedentota bacterium]